MHRLGAIAMFAAALFATGCGPTASTDTARTTRVTDAGDLTLAASLDGGASSTLLVDYAAAGLTICDGVISDGGTLVLFGAFTDGQVGEKLDLTTMSLAIDLAELPVERGPVDIVLAGDTVNLYLESASYESSTLLVADVLRGQLHLRYDSPPRPGITIQGTLSLSVVEIDVDGTPSTLTLEGAFEIPVIRSCG